MSLQSYQATAETLRGRLEEGRQRAARLRAPVLVSVAHEVPDLGDMTSLFAAAGPPGWSRSLWARPSEGWWTVGSGQVLRLEGRGHSRFAQVQRSHEAVMESAVIDAPDVPGVGPLCFGGLRFDLHGPRSPRWAGYEDALFALPRFAFSRLAEKGSWLTTNVMVDATSDPEGLEASLEAERDGLRASAEQPTRAPRAIGSTTTSRARWRRMVGEVLQLIDRKEVDKVVLARRLRLRLDGPILQEAALQYLTEDYPGCLVFAVGRGGTAFLGATPELLVDLCKGRVRATCLAGSAPRGATVEQDEVLGQGLLEGPKDQREHLLTVQAVERGLAELCSDLRRDAVPSLTRLPTVQHLATTFTATTSRRRHVLELVERLHPTPAVGGTPSRGAQETLRALEQMDRGWYAGPVGWLDPSGDGHFGVAIRSALVRDNEALLHAGAGIVAGSDPEQEFDETELKLEAMRSALTRGQ